MNWINHHSQKTKLKKWGPFPRKEHARTFSIWRTCRLLLWKKRQRLIIIKDLKKFLEKILKTKRWRIPKWQLSPMMTILFIRKTNWQSLLSFNEVLKGCKKGSIAIFTSKFHWKNQKPKRKRLKLKRKSALRNKKRWFNYWENLSKLPSKLKKREKVCS